MATFAETAEIISWVSLVPQLPARRPRYLRTRNWWCWKNWIAKNEYLKVWMPTINFVKDRRCHHLSCHQVNTVIVIGNNSWSWELLALIRFSETSGSTVNGIWYMDFLIAVTSKASVSTNWSRYSNWNILVLACWLCYEKVHKPNTIPTVHRRVTIQ